MLIAIVRAISLLSWCVPVLLFAQPAIRTSIWRERHREGTKAGTVLVALVTIGFTIRRIVFAAPEPIGTELATWVGLYVLSAIAAQCLTWTVWSDG